ncbi:AlpA family phage regulatory protein [uncultured Novosphingobium sp.]|uniref:helix-turn-helix transcriptional regulator n=1 Tax=uncultured Novosphingobium sp. TaxID=292277 RepID=UPI0025970CC2|nr:AlpA family phage regulatory protein [uncultured Novosphingobium sp.]
MTADRRHDNLLRLAEVKSRTGLSRTTLYKRMASGTFPNRVQISPGLVAWYESDIDDWVANPMGWCAPS